MDAETSVIARKLRNFYVVENRAPAKKRRAPAKIQRPIDEDDDLDTTTSSQSEGGYFKNLLMVFLMGAAVYLTELSLILIKWVRRLETN